MEGMHELGQCLARDLKRQVPDQILSVLQSRFQLVEEVLQDPDLRRSVIRAGAHTGSSRTDEEKDELRRATDTLERSARYRELRTTVRELLDATGAPQRQSRGAKPPGPDRPPLPLYVELMALAMTEPFAEERYTDIVAEPPILGGYEDGQIWIQADPWVPRKAVFEYYQALQRRLGTPPREVVRDRTLDLYLWVRARRENSRELWRETMEAWNRVRTHKYKNESNFHKDFHRIEKSFLPARERFSALRDRALTLEAEWGGDSRVRDAVTFAELQR